MNPPVPGATCATCPFLCESLDGGLLPPGYRKCRLMPVQVSMGADDWCWQHPKLAEKRRALEHPEWPPCGDCGERHESFSIFRTAPNGGDVPVCNKCGTTMPLMNPGETPQ